MTTKPQTHLPLPDPPDRTPEEMTNFNHMNLTGNTHHLVHHLGNPDSTLVAGEHYVTPDPPETMTGLRYPDLIVAFGVNPAAYYQSNAYIISEQGKPPDFVLEIASPRHGGRGREQQACRLCGTGHTGVLAVQRGANPKQPSPGRRPAGGRRVPTHPHRHSA